MAVADKVAELQLNVETVAEVLATFKESEHDWPPKEMANTAVPSDAGVPAIEKVMLPVPLLSVPPLSVAVSPVTPVDETAVPSEKATPLPPE